MTTHTVLIAGAGHAGIATAVALRAKGHTGRIVVADAEGRDPYERPHLSKDMLKVGGPDEPTLLRKPAFLEGKGIERLSGVSLTGVDVDARTASLDDGSCLAWDDLVIATGSVTRDLPAPGGRLPGHHRLKTVEDAHAIKANLVPGARVVVIGAGYIGLEVAAAAAAAGCDVTVLEFADRVMSRVTSEQVSLFYQQLHESHGVRFAFGTAVTGVTGDGRVEQVHTANGVVYAADLVIEGVGVRPNQRLAQDAGIICDDGIVVDGDGRTSVPHVYAAGDVTRFPALFDGASQRLECISNALEQADRVAARITGNEPAAREVPWFWTIQHGVRLQTAGVRQPDDRVVVRGTPESGTFSVLYLRDGRLAAVDTIGGLKDFRAGKKLVAERALIDPALAADQSVPLADTLLAPNISAA